MALAGFALGASLAKLLGDKYYEVFKTQMDVGGLLLWVKTDDPEQEARALSILNKHGAKDTHIHKIEITK